MIIISTDKVHVIEEVKRVKFDAIIPEVHDTCDSITSCSYSLS